MYYVYSQNLMVRKEKETVSLQLKLIEKRAVVTARVRQEIEESRRIIGMQMEQIEQQMEAGNHADRNMIETYLEELQRARAKEYRGTYCKDPLVDEILCEIQENAEEKGLQVRILMNGYEPGKVTQEDLSQLLYCIGFVTEGKEGNLELSITSSNEKLMLRMKSPLIHISRMRSILANQIVRSYGGSLIMEHTKGGQVIYVYLNN